MGLVFSLSGEALRADENTEEFRLAQIFSDNMLFQQNKPIRVWGWGKAGSTVTVTFTEDKTVVADYLEKVTGKKTKTEDNPKTVRKTYVDLKDTPFTDQTVSTEVKEDGSWMLELTAVKADFTKKYLKVSVDDKHLAVGNILVGELWLATGQSNMVLPAYNESDLDVNRDYPDIRMYTAHDSYYQPREDLSKKAQWKSIDGFERKTDISSVAYLFAKHVQEYLQVPVGVMNVARGGTVACAWANRDLLNTIEHETVKQILTNHDEQTALWSTEEGRAQKKQEYKQKLIDTEKAYAERVASAKEKGGKIPKKKTPGEPGDARIGWSPPSGLFNAMVWPLRHMNISGVIYYQGENNCFKNKWYYYEDTYSKVIPSIRQAFADDSLPFATIELPGWRSTVSFEDGLISANVVVRDVHKRISDKTAFNDVITTYDTGSDYIHPADKQKIGERCARWALATVYNKPVRFRGHKYKSMEIEGNKIKVYFEVDPQIKREFPKSFLPNVKAAPWMILPVYKRGYDNMKGFIIAGEDQKFYKAQVSAKPGNCLEISSENVPNPVAVRYAWHPFPEANAMSNKGQPIPVFRTDDWSLLPPIVEDEKKK